jgi:hypothetical protein
MIYTINYNLEKERGLPGVLAFRATMTTVNLLVGVYLRFPANYARAEAFLKPLVEDQRRRLGDDSPATISILNRMVGVYLAQTPPKFTDAEAFINLVRSDTQRKSPNGRGAAHAVYQMANLYFKQGKYGDVEQLQRRTWGWGPRHHVHDEKSDFDIRRARSISGGGGRLLPTDRGAERIPRGKSR